MSRLPLPTPWQDTAKGTSIDMDYYMRQNHKLN